MKFLKFLLVIIITYPSISLAQKVELINSGDLIKKGFKLYDTGAYKKAISLFNKVTRSDTNYVYSMYGKAVSCESDSEYTLAIKYCREAIALKEQREYEPDLYNTYGNILIDMKQPEEAIKVFDTAMAKYPSFSLFYYNKGIALLALQRNAEAELSFKQTLIIDPYMYSAHFKLGVAALMQGKIIPSFLSFIGYLLVNPEGKYCSNAINILSGISRSTDEILSYKNKRTTEPDESYGTVEEIVLSKIALDKEYKPIIALDDPICRQIQAVFEKLDYKSNDNDFWIQYYLPFYKKIFNDGRFELFINEIFSNANVAAIKDFDKRKKKEIDQLKIDAADYFNLIRSTRELSYNKRDSVTERYFFENGDLTGKGTLTNDGKALKGPWVAYYPAGNIKAKGNFDAGGNREGEWQFYFYNGNLQSKEHYINGKNSGEQVYYFENGNPSSVEHYVNGLAEGLVTGYFYAGNKRSTVNYKLDKKNGEERYYYANESLQSVKNYINGVLNGPTEEYYKNGNKKLSTNYINDKQNGPYKFYYETGGLSYEGQNVNDKAEGEWKYYYEDGHPKEKRNYINDNEDGIHEEYFDDGGQVSQHYVTTKGKIDGEVISYYKDGKIRSKDIYNNGIISASKFFNESGQEISSAQKQGDLFSEVSYTLDGVKDAHYFFDKKGNFQGTDTSFYSSGKIYQTNEYKDGDFNGLSTTYYLNGKIRSLVNMTDGKDDGYYTNYYVNGQIQSEGWLRDGDYQGQWNYYDELGRLTSITNYLDGDLDGYKEDYEPGGKKIMEQKYHRGWLELLTQYDLNGNIILIDSFPKCTGKYKLVFSNGKTKAEANYINGDFNGPYKTYYFDGSMESAFYYNKGMLDSTYTAYYYDGKKSSEGHYKSDTKAGVWKFYDEAGNITTTRQYANDLMNGPQVDYFENGDKEQESAYKNDQLNGLVKKHNTDGQLLYQVVFEDDKPVSYTYLGGDGKLVNPIPIPSGNGPLKAYFSNGKISRQCFYSDGVKNGADIIYYPNGQVKSLDSLAYDTFEGTSMEYYSDGKIKSVYHYVTGNTNGVCKEFGKNGSLKKEITYENGVCNGPTNYYDDNGKLIKTLLYNYGTLISVTNEK